VPQLNCLTNKQRQPQGNTPNSRSAVRVMSVEGVTSHQAHRHIKRQYYQLTTKTTVTGTEPPPARPNSPKYEGELKSVFHSSPQTTITIPQGVGDVIINHCQLPAPSTISITLPPPYMVNHCTSVHDVLDRAIFTKLLTAGSCFDNFDPSHCA
jgi:hypothetical protein